MSGPNSSFLLEERNNQSKIMRKNIWVKTSKLPSDFFPNPEINRYIPRKLSLKHSSPSR